MNTIGWTLLGLAIWLPGYIFTLRRIVWWEAEQWRKDPDLPDEPDAVGWMLSTFLAAILAIIWPVIWLLYFFAVGEIGKKIAKGPKSELRNSCKD